MRSAYLVLGVPGDATQEEIEAAFHRAEGQFSRERLAQENGALERLHEIRSAYDVLKDPESRAAHDRKLLGTVRPTAKPRVVVVAEEPPLMRRVMVIGVLVAAGVFGAGAFVTHRNAESRRLAAAQEEAARQQAAREVEEKRLAQERLALERQEQAARAADAERRLLVDAQASAARAESAIRQREALQRAELADAQRRDTSRLNDERRLAAEARQRTERDKQRVREICWQLYRRPDC